MGLLDRIFGGRKQNVPYPAELQPQIDKAMAGLQALTAAHDGVWQISQAAWSVDQNEGTITFTSPKGILATARADRRQLQQAGQNMALGLGQPVAESTADRRFEKSPGIRARTWI